MSLHQRLPALDGLRAVSILLVMASHLAELVGIHWIPGGAGVTVFFFISGFIITKLLLAEHERTADLHLRAFFVRRFFRLAPALLCYVLVSVLSLKAFGVKISGAAISAALLYAANYFNIYTTSAPLDPQIIISPLAVLWSLAVEEHFYLVFPFLMYGLRRDLRGLTRLLIVFVLVSLAWRLVLVYGVGLDQLRANRILMATDTRLDSIAFGCLLAVGMHRAARPGGESWGRFVAQLGRPVMLVAGLALFMATLALRDPAFRETLRYSLQGLALMPLFCALFGRPGVVRPLRFGASAILESRPALYVGAVSYSLYLYHFLALGLTQLALPQASGPMKLVVAAASGFALAMLSFHWIEVPTRRFGGRLADRLPATTATPVLRDAA